MEARARGVSGGREGKMVEMGERARTQAVTCTGNKKVRHLEKRPTKQ